MSSLKSFFIPTKFTLVNKICLAAIFIALGMILNQVICIKEIPIIPFVKISLGGPALIILSSLLLGPLFGALVGGAVDFLGYLIFDFKTFAYFPQITLTYILLGFVPGFIFALVKNIKNKKIMMGIEISFMSILFIGLTLFFIFNNSVKLYGKVYTFELYQKILLLFTLFILCGFTLLITFLMDKMYSKREDKEKLILNPYQISFVCFIVEILIMVIFGTLMKGISFGFTMYPAILVCQIITMFINIPLNICLISYILLLTRKYYTKI